MKRQEAASSFESPWGRRTPAQGAACGRSRGGRPGSAFPRMSTLSPNTFPVLGERARVRGLEGANSRNRRFVPTHLNRTTKRLIRDGARNAPLSRSFPPNRPKVGDSGGEETKCVETLPQGCARSSCLSLALGYNSVTRTGLSEEPAASYRWTSRKRSNLQSPRGGRRRAAQGLSGHFHVGPIEKTIYSAH